MVSGIYTYTGDECMQVNFYFPSSTIRMFDTTYAFDLILCNFPLGEGIDIFDALARALKTTPERLSTTISNAKRLLMRLIQVDMVQKTIIHLNINNDIQQYNMSDELVDSIHSGDIQQLIRSAMNNEIIPKGVKMNIRLINAELLHT